MPICKVTVQKASRRASIPGRGSLDNSALACASGLPKTAGLARRVVHTLARVQILARVEVPGLARPSGCNVRVNGKSPFNLRACSRRTRTKLPAQGSPGACIT